MNVEGIKGSIDLSTENLFKQLDAVESRLNKFAASRGNDGAAIASEMKAVINAMLDSQIDFADGLKKSFDGIEKAHVEYGRKAKRMEKQITEGLVKEVVSRNAMFAQSYAETSQLYMQSLMETNRLQQALLKSKIADRVDSKEAKAAAALKKQQIEDEKNLAMERENSVREWKISENKIRAEKAASEKEEKRRIKEAVALQKQRDKENFAAIKAAEKAQEDAHRRNLKIAETTYKKIKGFISGVVWAPVIANQTMQMFQGVEYTIKGAWDAVYGTIIDVNSAVEDYLIRIKVSTGSLTSAKEVWADVKKYATESVFTFQDTVQAATTLIPILRGGKDELKKWLPVIGDLAAAFGLTYEEAATNFAKLYGAGIGAADLFRDKGISGALGFTPGKHYSGKESSKQLWDEWIKNNSLFRGTAEELNKNWSGIVSQMRDQWFLFVKDLGDAGIFQQLKYTLSSVLDAFKKFRETGEPYYVFLKNVSDLLDRVLQKTIAFFKNLFENLQKSWLFGSIFEGLLSTEEEKAAQAKLEDLKGQKEVLENFKRTLSDPLSGGGEQSASSVANVTAKIDALNVEIEEQSRLLIPFSQRLATVVEQYKQIANDGDLDFTLLSNSTISAIDRVAAQEQAKLDSLKLYFRRKANTEDMLSKKERAEAEVSEEIMAQQQKANLDLIKYQDGEWASFVAEVEIETNKLKDKIVDARKKAGLDPEEEAMGKFVDQYKESKLMGKRLEYANEISKSINDVETSIKSSSLTDYENDLEALDNEFSRLNTHLLNLPPELQEWLDKLKGLRIEEIELKKATADFGKEMDYQKSMTDASIPSWNAYRKELNNINAEYEKAVFNAGKMKTAEAEQDRQRKISILNANTLASAEEQLNELRYNNNSFGRSNYQQQIDSYSRGIRNMLESDVPEIRKKGEELKDEYKKNLDHTTMQTFKDGWIQGWKEITDSTLTAGDAIRTGLTDIFSELQSSLSDVFFDAFKGNLKDAKEAFESFADGVMKSISQIMANKVASGVMQGGSGLFDMIAGLFHSGGVVGQGGGSTRVNPLVFAGAPRFHTGNLGLSADEYPAILQKGELIIPKGWENRTAGGGAVSVNIKNESGQSLAVTKSSASQDVSGYIIDVVIDAAARNKGGLRDILAAR